MMFPSTKAVSLSKACVQQGATLVELVMAIVIAGIAMTTLLLNSATLTGRSADPLLRTQSLAIAEAYLEEILNRNYLDPATGSLCPASPANRNTYDNVCDYAAIVPGSSITDQNGTPITLLGAYSVGVAVSPSSQLNGLPSSAVLRVTVTVTDPAGNNLQLSGYKVGY